MNIFVSNDDGINSKALHVLVKELSNIGDVYVVAPDSERSAFSHHFTIKGKMRVEQKQVEGAKQAFSLAGTPCDCVHAGLQALIKEKIDLVVSGINKGGNFDCDVIYSGTLAAAREGFMQNVPAIAVSLDSFVDDNYEYAAKVARQIAVDYMNDPRKNEYYLNINVPNIKEDEVKGIKICDHKGTIRYNEGYHIESEFGVDYLVTGIANSVKEYDPKDMHVDLAAIENGYVTVTPLYNDHINYEFVEELKTKYEK